MSVALVQQIEARMKAQNISIMTLENKAGLKTHAVRNILRGKSKRPSAHNLQAIADVLSCSVKDLLGAPEALQETKQHEPLEIILEKKYLKTSNPQLMPETIKNIEELIRSKDKDITVEQFLTCVREVYLHSLQRDPSKVDREFAEWFIDLFMD